MRRMKYWVRTIPTNLVRILFRVDRKIKMIICVCVASLELPMMEVVAFIRDEKLRRAQKNKKNECRLIYIVLV
uniref:Putative ovule protein n=1 Tax=Solanum chacoense TaxID=4108 RepID=A0A0V0HFP3_SOLCH